MFKKLFAVATILSVYPWLAGCPCDCAPGEPLAPSIVQGTVTDSVTGQPLADATVATNNSEYVLTDANGRYSVSRPDAYLTVLKRGYYADLTQASQFAYGTTVTHNVALVPGDVTDSAGPVAPRPRGINKSYGESVIEWELPTAEPLDFAGFVVYRGTEPIRLTLYQYLVTQRLSDPASCYSVAAIDASGNESPRSAELCAVLTGCAASALDRVEPSLSVVSSTEIKVRWGVSATKPFAEHRIYRDGVLLRVLGPGENRDVAASTEWYNYYTYVDTGLSPNIRYCYSVAAGSDGTQGCDQLCISTWP